MGVTTKRFMVEVDFVEYSDGYEVKARSIEDAVVTYLQSLEMDGEIKSFEGIDVKEVTE